MADLAEFAAQNLEAQAGPGYSLFETVVLDDAVAGQPVRVRLPESPELATDPCPWTPIVTVDGFFYPHAGDRCVVVQPVQGNPWIAGWTPSTDVPDGGISGSGDKHFEHNQSTPSATWTINHNLGKRPSVTIVDSAGTEWITEVDHVSDNQCVAYFAHAFSGKAYCN